MSDLNDKDTLLARWLSGDLSAEELKSLEGQEDFADLKRIVKGADQLKMPAFDKKSAFAKIKAKKEAQSKAPVAKVRRISFARYAAAAMVLLLIGFFFINPFGNSLTNHETVAAQQESITLPDGSEVFLNHQSQLSYNAKKWSKNRTLNLEGEAFFKVEKGSSFQVITDNGTVTVLGTSFNIYTRNNIFEVSCHTGKVEVKSDGSSVELTPNKKSTLINQQLEVADIETGDNPLWKNGLSKFNGEKLERIIQELEFQFDIDIQNGNVNTQETFTGAFLHKDVETALKMIFDPMGISYKIEGRQIILSQ